MTPAPSLRTRSAYFAQSLALQFGTVGIALIASVFLARGFAPEARGQLAYITLASSIVALFGSLGIPEAAMVQRLWPSDTPIRARIIPAVAFTTVADIVGVTIIHIDGVVALSAVSVLAMWSCFNTYLLTDLQISRGLPSVLLVRLVYTIASTVGVAVCVLAIQPSSPRFASIPVVWAIAEVLLFFYLKRVAIRPPSIATADKIGARAALPFLLAQLGSLAADRGAIFVGLATGNTVGAGFMTVAQSAIAPAAVPIQASASAIIAESSRDLPLKSEHHVSARSTALIGVALASIALGVGLPFVAAPVFGDAYSFIGHYSWAYAALALISGLWRLQHLSARGRGRPYLALSSDLVAIGFASVFVVFASLGTGAGVTEYLLSYAGVGLAAILVVNFAARLLPGPSER